MLNLVINGTLLDLEAILMLRFKINISTRTLSIKS